MNHRLVASTALASVLAMGLLNAAQAQEAKDKEKCYGVAKAGAGELNRGRERLNGGVLAVDDPL